MKTVEQINLENKERLRAEQLAQAALSDKQLGELREEKYHLAMQKNLTSLNQSIQTLPNALKLQTNELVSAILRGIDEAFGEKSLNLAKMEVSAVDIKGLNERLEEFQKVFIEIQSAFKERMEAIEVIVPEGKTPQVTVEQTTVDTSDITKGLQSLEKAIKNLKLEGKSEKVDLSPLLKEIKNLKLIIPEQRELDQTEVIEAIEGVGNRIANLRFPIANPVNQIDINPLRGIPKTTQLVVGSNPTPLPATNLANRRTLIIYNEDAALTVRLGGSGVTFSGATAGIPVPPLSYSPPFDIGNTTTLYGIVTSGSANVTCMEVSNDNIGSS